MDDVDIEAAAGRLPSLDTLTSTQKSLYLWNCNVTPADFNEIVDSKYGYVDHNLVNDKWKVFGLADTFPPTIISPHDKIHFIKSQFVRGDFRILLDLVNCNSRVNLEYWFKPCVDVDEEQQIKNVFLEPGCIRMFSGDTKPKDYFKRFVSTPVSEGEWDVLEHYLHVLKI